MPKDEFAEVHDWLSRKGLGMNIQYNLSEFSAAHSGSVRINGVGKLVFNDETGTDWHILRVFDERLRNQLVRLTVKFKPAETCDTVFHVNHWGGLTIANIAADGSIVDRGISERLTVTGSNDGFMVAEIDFWSGTDALSLGTATSTEPRVGQYRGHGRDQFIFDSISVHILPGPQLAEEDKIVLIDVGARFGMDGVWQPYWNRVRPIMFEPDPEGAAPLMEQIRSFTSGEVV